MSTKYNEYLSEHLANVRKAYFWLKDHAIIDLKEFESYFLKQLNIHDLSKYSQEEYYAYDNYFYGAETEKVKKDFDYAWLHHIHQNPHHWQHWVLVNDDGGTYALEMPKEFRHVADRCRADSQGWRAGCFCSRDRRTETSVRCV